MPEVDREAIFDLRLFEELYGVQPQAITWMHPIWDEAGTTIIDFEYVYSNKVGLDYLNLTPEQHQGLRISTSPTLTDDLRKIVLEEITRVYLTGEDSKTNTYNPVLNKYARVLRTRLRGGVLSIIQERTEENRMIRELEDKTRMLEEQKNLLDSILKNSSNGISVSKVFRDANGKVVDAQTILANDAAVRYIGIPREVYLTKRATELEPAVIDSPYYQACIGTLETGTPFMMQYEMQSTRRWLELTVSRLDYNHLIQIFTDVTPVKEAQIQLEQSASNLRTVFDAAQTGMFTFSPEYDSSGNLIDFRFVMANPAVAAYVGQTPAALEGDLGSRWFPGYLTNGVFDMYKHTFLTGEVQRKEVYYNVDGHDNFLDIQSVKVDNLVLVSFTDHTPLRKSKLQLEHSIEELKRVNQNLEQFTYAASHDMKEPLRKIQFFTNRLESQLGDRLAEQERLSLNRIENAAQRMKQLIEDLLEYSHVSKGKELWEEINLNQKVSAVVDDLETTIQEKKAVVQIDPLPTVRGHRRQLQQLFQNLISNALKYSRDEAPPIIHISAEHVKGKPAVARIPVPPGAYHWIKVQDNGIGFAQADAERIFHVFTRLHGKSEYSGTGIGLSIVQKVVENHGGYIWAEGEPGKGATFHILFTG